MVRVLLLAMALVFGTACNREASGDYLKQGKKLLAAKKYPHAILLFKKQARLQPKDPEPVYQLGIASIAAGDVPTGVSYLRKAISLDPRHVAAHKSLAELMVGSVNADVLTEAKTLAEHALAASPNDADLLELLSSAEMRLGQREAAERRLAQALEKFPQHLKSAMSLSSLHLANGDRAAAERVLRTAAAAAPDRPEPALALGRLYRMIGETSEAEQEYRRALQIDGNNGAVLLALATLLQHTGNIAGAEELYRKLSTGLDARMRPVYGTFLAGQHRYSEATAEFRRLFQQDASDRDARSRLVSSLVTERKLGEASQILKQALSKNGKDTEALLQSAEIDLLLNNPAAAQTSLAHVVRYRPESAPARYLLARAHRMRGEFLHYRQELSEAVKLDGNFLRARTELARLFIEENKPQNALDLMNAGPEWQRRDPAGILERNWALFALGQIPELRRGIAGGLAHARTPGLLVQQAFVAILDKQYEVARASAAEALQKNPEELQALSAIARSFILRSDASRAKAAVLQHAAAHPRSPRIQQFVGEWLRKHGSAEEARQHFTAAVAVAPDYLPARLALADLDMRHGRLDAARETLVRVVDRAPRSVVALTQLAQVEVLQGRKAEAIIHYRKIVETDARNQPALNNLAFLLVDTNPDEALLFAQRAKELAPGNPTVDDTLGWALYNKGHYSAAVRHLETAAKSGDPLHQYHLAIAYAKSGDRRRGEQILAAAVKSNPNLPEAAMARKALNGY